MSKMTFLSNNYTDEADFSIISGGEEAQFPVENIQHPFTTKVFRSTSDVSEILIDLHITTSIDSFAVVGSTIDGIGFTTATLYGSPTVDFTASTPIEIDLSAEHNFGFKLFDVAVFRFWKLELTNTAGFCEVSNIYIGKKTEISDNAISVDSFSYSQNDNSNISKNEYGQKFIDVRNTIMSLGGTVKYANSSEFETLNDIHVYHGKHTPIWFILDPDGTMSNNSQYLFSGYFHFAKDFNWKSSGPRLFDITIELEEAV